MHLYVASTMLSFSFIGKVWKTVVLYCYHMVLQMHLYVAGWVTPMMLFFVFLVFSIKQEAALGLRCLILIWSNISKVTKSSSLLCVCLALCFCQLEIIRTRVHEHTGSYAEHIHTPNYTEIRTQQDLMKFINCVYLNLHIYIQGMRKAIRRSAQENEQCANICAFHRVQRLILLSPI